MTSPTLIQDLNLSQSWLEVLKRLIDISGNELSPLVLTITDFDEIESIRKALDNNLITHNKQLIQTVSETIFPDSLYRLFKDNRCQFFNEYKSNFKRIKELDLMGKKRNARGTYFQRLIDYPGKNGRINQLEKIIESILDDKNNRRSRFQATTFDPNTDLHDNPYLGFPCLQHVTFYVTKEEGLVLNSFYALQYVFEKAYGNWLGLINLGRFVSKEIGVQFGRFNCFISIEILDTLTKKQASSLYDQAAKGMEIS